MKTVKLFLGALACAAVSMFVAPVASAQTADNRDDNGKIVRGPYLTNKFSDNWFVSVAGGVNLFMDGNFKTSAGGALDINAGKWITPAIGLRGGYSGLTGALWSEESSILGLTMNESRNMFKQKFGFAYVHADVLWNISHAIGGYKETRLWNFIPYAHTGWLRTYDRGDDASDFSDNEFAMGLGLLNAIRLTERLDLTLDVRGILTNGRHHAWKGGVAGAIQTTVGLSVDLGKTNWVRASSCCKSSCSDAAVASAASDEALAVANAALEQEKKALAEEKAALENEKAALQKKNDELAQENADLQGALLKAKDNKTSLQKVTPAAFYFEIGKTTLNAKEAARLELYLSHAIPYVKGKTLTVVTGSADKSTGSAERNQYLSQKRAEYIKDILVQEYGLSVDQCDFRTNIVAEGDPALGRSVIISFE